MLSLFLSTVAFFVASYFLKRRFDELGFPKTIARGIVIFVTAMLVSYGVGFVVDRVAGLGNRRQCCANALRVYCREGEECHA